MSNKPAHMLDTPKWIPIVRIVQAVLAVAILGMSAYGIYWVSFAAWCLALFTALVTFVIVAYNLGTTFIASAHSAYNYWAVLGLDIFAAIFWLASMAALAALRSTFKYKTTIHGCYNDGYGGVCYRKRDVLHKRAVATYAYLDMMSASAGISAILMLLFILTLAINAIRIRAHRANGGRSGPNAAEKGSAHAMSNVSTNAQQPVYTGPQTQTQTQPQQPAQQYVPPPQQQPQYTGPQTHQQQYQQYPHSTPSPVSTQGYGQYPQTTQSPPPQQYGYASPTQSTAYQPSPVSTPAPQHAHPVPHQQVHEVPTGYQPPPQGYSEVHAEHKH